MWGGEHLGSGLGGALSQNQGPRGMEGIYQGVQFNPLFMRLDKNRVKS